MKLQSQDIRKFVNVRSVSVTERVSGRGGDTE